MMVPTGSDWWVAGGAPTPWAAYQPKGAASFAASLIDLTGNGNNAGDPGGANTPDWDAVNGWDFDATASEYLTTAFVPGDDNTQSVIVQFTGASVNGGMLAGARHDSDSQVYLGPRKGGSDDREYANAGAVTAGARVASGNMAVAGNRGYYNGIAEGAAMGAWVGGIALVPLHIGRLNRDDAAPGNYFTGYIQALVIYDSTITAAQVLAVATAMAAL
jgi:hypothetical protein